MGGGERAGGVLVRVAEGGAQVSDHYKGLVVTFEDDLSAEYVAKLTSALCLFKGVMSVTALTASSDDFMARDRVRWEMEKRLWAALREAPK
jgi:hydrogenase/urease accessory protein HupE